MKTSTDKDSSTDKATLEVYNWNPSYKLELFEIAEVSAEALQQLQLLQQLISGQNIIVEEITYEEIGIELPGSQANDLVEPLPFLLCSLLGAVDFGDFVYILTKDLAQYQKGGIIADEEEIETCYVTYKNVINTALAETLLQCNFIKHALESASADSDAASAITSTALSYDSNVQNAPSNAPQLQLSGDIENNEADDGYNI